MKKIFLALICLIGIKITMAQQSQLSFDEHNKYIYYEVTDMPGFDADSLQMKTTKFLRADFPKLKLKDSATDKTEAAGKFLIYGNTGLFRHETGQVSYTLHLEFKDQRYRFWLTDFVCTPYQRDRYGNFAPEQGIDIPLESINVKFEKADAESYLNQTGSFCKQFGEKLKKFLTTAHTQKKEKNTRKIVTDKW